MDYEEKERLVGKVFSNVADSYDVMNDAMSLGVHRLWKDCFIDMIGPLKMRKLLNEKGEVIGEEPLKILDVAGGTGDISFRILDKAKLESVGSIFTNFYILRVISGYHSLRYQQRYVRGGKEESCLERKLPWYFSFSKLFRLKFLSTKCRTLGIVGR